MRSVDDLLAELAALGVTVTCSGADLRVRGPVGALSPALRQELAAQKPALIAALQAPKSGSHLGSPPGLTRSATPASTAPLSFNQQRLWFLDRLENGGNAFVLVAGWKLSGQLDHAALEQALSALVARHELLRSVIQEENGQAQLRILAPAPAQLKVQVQAPAQASAGAPPNSGLTPAAAAIDDLLTQDEAAIDALLAQEANTAFDLSGAPPFRVKLVRLQQPPGAVPCHVLVLAIHHIAADFWSMGVLMRELGLLYGAAREGAASPLPALPIEYSDYARWQRAALGEAQLAPHLQFWTRQLAGAVTELALPLDRPRPAERGALAAMYRFQLEPTQAQQIQSHALRVGATPFMVLLAAYALVLGRWSGQEELVIGCPVSNRDKPETQGLVGFFIDTMPLRIDLSDDPGFDTLVRRVRAVCLDAFAHQDLPFERIVQALKPERSLNKAPLFQTMFVLQTGERHGLQMQGLEVQALSVQPGAPELDINFSAEAFAGGYACVMEYDADLFDEAGIAELSRQFSHVLTAACAAPAVPLSTLALAPASHPALPTPAVAPISLPQAIARVAAQFPQRVAIQSGARALRYGEMMDQVRRLAARLQAAGVQAGQVVGLALPSSTELVLAMLASWQAGAAYVVLSPAQPAARRAQMMESAGVALLLSTRAHAPEWSAAKLLLMDEALAQHAGESSHATQDWPQDGMQDETPASALAYVCFTSGSSGTPKGVAVSHGNLANHARAVVEEFGLVESDRVLQFAAADFDVAAEEIFPTLLAGACLVMRAEGVTDSIDAFHEHVQAERLTVLNLPAAFWHEWVRMLEHSGGRPPASLRLLVTGSDRVYAHRLRQWQALCRHPVAFRSGYGPTEATITAAFFDPQRDALPASAEILPLGRPLANVQIEIVDAAGRAVPPGVIGEIMIEGAGVAQGYLGLPEQSAAVFGIHPQVPNLRVYRSGDLGRLRSDGALEFIGRKDGQAKVRGYRIELAEIEAALIRHPRLREAAVLVRRDAAGQSQLVAAVVAEDADAPALRAWLAERLPAYMVPAVFLLLPALPRSASGKVDVRTLAGMAPTQDMAPADMVQADGAVESALAKLFAEVLDLKQVGVADNVFELGIDSIRSLQIVSRARQLGVNMTVRDIFKFQTIRDLVRGLPETGAASSSLSVAEAEEGETAPTPIQAWFMEQIVEGREHYNQSLVLRVPQAFNAAAMEQALQALVAHHPSLRLCLAQGGLQVMPAAQAGSKPLMRVLDQQGLSTQAAAGQRAAAYAETQQGMDLARAQLLRALLVQPEGRLLIAVHHLAIDAYSWSVLLEDLLLAYQQSASGLPISLPAPSSSSATWARRLAALAATPEALAHVCYFTEQFGRPGASVLPPQSPGRIGGVESILISLPEATTSALLHAIPKAWGARVDEVLLAALALAAGRIGAATSMQIDLERNGRAQLFEDLDLSRTIGWFTSVQPVAVSVRAGDDFGALLERIGEAVRASPWQGVGMGALRYLAPDAAIRAALAALPPAEILLNYLGRMDLRAGEGQDFAVLEEHGGPAQHAEIARSHVIEINAGIWSGCLKMEIAFPAAGAQGPRMQRWADEIGTALEAMASQAQAALAQATPADGAAEADSIVDELPLTPLQQGILFHSLRNPDSDAYFDQLWLTLEGPLDAAALHSAWERALARHGMLRTSFHWQDVPSMVQRVHAKASLPWREEDWRHMSATQRAAAMQELMRQEREQGFDLRQAPLMRLQLIRTAEHQHALLWNAHHLLLDGWSVSVLMSEIFVLYRQALGEANAQLPPASDFGAYVRWQARHGRQGDQAFWRQHLQGLEEPTSLAFARQARDPLDPSASEVVDCRLSLERSQAIQRLAQQARTTVGTVLQAAWALLLGRCSGSRDVLFGVTVSGRPPELAGVETMIGMLIATLPARFAIPADLPLTDWLRRLQEQHLEREQHAATPLTEIKQLSDMPAGAELFQSLVLIQNYPANYALRAAGLSLAAVSMHENTNYPLTLVCSTAGPLQLLLYRDRQQIAQAAARRLLDQLADLLDAMAGQPLRAAADFIPLRGALAKVALAAGHGPREEIAPAFLPQQVDAWARSRPTALALADQDGELSYAELSRQSQRLAQRLHALGVGSEAVVALSLPPSPRYVLAALAIWRCGGVLLPLDPAYPRERRRFMLEDSQATLLIADDAHVPDAAPGLRLLRPQDWFAAAEQDDGNQPAWPPLPSLTADAAAYVIYTSGSTGKPKGVINTHGGLRSLAHAQRSIFKLGGGERVLQFASLSFDASIWEISMALGAGVTLLVPKPGTARPGPDLQAFMRAYRVTAATLPPTALATLESDALPDLQLLVVAGESCAPELAWRWAAGRRFYNAYGPSEASVAASIEVGVQERDLLPIGRPLPNVQLHVLDENLQPLPPGVIGELYIGGAGLARGYLGRDALTAASFVPDPHAEPRAEPHAEPRAEAHAEPGARLYKTGDRAYRLADGRVQFVGRIDHQVKLRGFRIELGEIEAALAQHPQVSHAAVLVRSHGPGDRRLTAWLETPQTLGADVLRSFLKASLPEHMIPASFISLPAFPLTPSGKIDRQALERLGESALPAAASAVAQMNAAQIDAAPATASEMQLCRIWEQVLGVAAVHTQQNFFELGGDSILAIQVVAKANQQGIAITLNQIMDPASQTVAALALLAAQAGNAAPVAGALEQPAAAPGPVPLTPIQFWFLQQDAPERHHYNQSFLLEVPADLDAACLEAALNAVQQRHDALRLRFARTPAGWQQRLVQAVPLRVDVMAPQGGAEQAAAGQAAWRAMLEAEAARLQGRLDIESGPLIRATLFPPPPGIERARLHLVVHHLAIDAVSWRVLLDDLFDAYAQAQAGAAIQMPRAAASFCRWSEALTAYAASKAALADLPHWLAQPAQGARLPLLREDLASTVKDAQTISLKLAEAPTSALLRSAPRAHGGQMQELLLAALGSALAETSDAAQVTVAIESHGRDMPLAGIDVSNAIGWFTVLAPLCLPLPRPGPAADAAARIQAVRRALQAMPGRGFSFGALRYLSPDPAIREALAALPAPQILFNYLGQWDTLWPGAVQVGPAPESDGSGFAPSTPRAFALEINALVAGGCLQLDLSFDPRALEPGFARRLGERMLAWLAELTASLSTQPASFAVGLQPAAAPAQPASFPLGPQQAAVPAQPTSFAVGPQQAAMLAHARAHPASLAYIAQFSARLPADLDVAAFMAAWRSLIARHIALRAVFFQDGQGETRQRFCEECAAPWLQEDWSRLSPAESAAALRTHCDQQQARGFDTGSAPLMRFSLLRLAEGMHFVWTYHHLLLDGWSMPVLLGELLSLYRGQAPAGPAPDFRQFLTWLDGRDRKAAQAFWQAELAGLPASRWPARDDAGHPAGSGRFAQCMLHLPAGLGPRLAALARTQRLALPSLLLQAWAHLLARRTGSGDVCFGVTSALRPPEVAGVEAMVGALLATHPLRHTVDEGLAFAESALLLQGRRLAAAAHAGASLDEIARHAGRESAHGLFGSVLRIQNYPLGELGGLGQAQSLAMEEVAIRDTWHFPFNLEITPGQNMVLIAVYDELLVDAALAAGILDEYGRILAALDDGAVK